MFLHTSVLCTFFPLVLQASTISSMTCSSYVNNNESELGRVVGSNQTANVIFDGKWFSSGECELFVNDVLVGSSSNDYLTYTLTGSNDSLCTYRLTLKSDLGEINKVVNFLPTAEFPCAFHTVSISNSFLDSRPAGTVRRLAPKDSLPVVWSGIWNHAADSSVVTLYKGNGTSSEAIAMLVDSSDGSEGVYKFSRKDKRLPGGLYTLTHFDGVERLIAYVDVLTSGLILTVK